jgi:acetylornithine deacetylase/succinyl-diaminopimelate desuccinylase-like protein
MRASLAVMHELAPQHDIALVLEAGRENGDIVGARKGGGNFVLETHGRAAHAGVEPEKGAHAVLALAHHIIALQGLNGMRDGITVNVGVIEGGSVPNAVPDYAQAVIDTRAVRPEDIEPLVGALRAEAARTIIPGVRAELSGGWGAPPMAYTSAIAALAQLTDACAQELGFRVQAAKTGGVSYANYLASMGLPVLDGLAVPLGIVGAIVGLSRLAVTFTGSANHAGTTPMHARRDAVAGAAEWIGAVESLARRTPGLVATVGRLRARPGAANVIAGVCEASLDVRHASDDARATAVESLRLTAQQIAARRELSVQFEMNLEQPSVAMSAAWVAALERAVAAQGLPIHRIDSGAGHDAMILAGRMPVAMLFLRSPGGISHHPDEAVIEADVVAALGAGLAFLDDLAEARP